jgi:hypothetical protein
MTPRTNRHAFVVALLAGLGWLTPQAAAAPNVVNGWILNDLGAAQEEAHKTGKPIFVTIRCES